MYIELHKNTPRVKLLVNPVLQSSLKEHRFSCDDVLVKVEEIK